MDIVAGVVEKEGKVLFIRRNKPPFRDKLIFPGGKVEEGEMPGEAMERELMEETNLKIKNMEEKGFYHEKLTDGKDYEHRIRIYHIDPDGFDFTSSEEGETIAINKTELSDHKNEIVPSDYRIAERILFEKEAYFRAKVIVRKKSKNYVLEKEEDY